jgi:hypothetical protein
MKNQVVLATRLLWQSSLMSQGFTSSEEVSDDPAQASKQNISRLDDIIELIKDLKQRWAELNSEQIIERLEQASKEENTEVTEVNLSTQPELWLLKALALEKSLTADIADVEKYYSKCRGGIFQAVLVLNNCGVVQAKRQKCSEALELFKDAMIGAYTMDKLAKAPFYNFALIVAHLYKQRFIFQSGYLALLEEVIRALPFLEDLRRLKVVTDTDGEPVKTALGDAEIRLMFNAIAKFAHEIIESPADEFYHSKLSYLVLESDLLDSFGDISDKVDRERASEVFEEGRALFDQKLYAESINVLETASSLAPDYSKGAAEEIEKVFDAWRYELNKTIFKLAGEKKFDEAIEILQNLPDQRLARQNDKSLIENLQKRKQLWMLQQADELAEKRCFDEAKLKYKLLLREELSDHLKRHVSTKLAELLKADGQPLSEDKQD